MGDVTLVSRNVRGEHGIQVFPYGEELFPFGDIPHGTESEVGPATAANDEQFAIGAEVQAVRITFGKWDDSGNLEVVGIIKNHLPLTANGNERSPRTNGDASGDTGSIGAHKGVEREHFYRHGCGAFGSFAERIWING